MTVEDTFRGAKSGLSFMCVYLQLVAEEMGPKKALALDSKAAETLGQKTGRRLKEQAGVGEVDIKTAAKMLTSLIEENFGITSEVAEENPHRISFKCGRCPIYEASKVADIDNKEIEAECRADAIIFMDEAARQLNSNLSYKLNKFRSSAEDFCEESLVLEK